MDVIVPKIIFINVNRHIGKWGFKRGEKLSRKKNKKKKRRLQKHFEQTFEHYEQTLNNLKYFHRSG